MTAPHTPPLQVTRVANSCVLLRLGPFSVLTDPWFTERWHLHRGEPLGLRVADLPELTAIVVSHFFPNHWDLRALAAYPHRDTTVVVGEDRMAAQAALLGYRDVRVGHWGDTVAVRDGLTVEVVEAHTTMGRPDNSYVLATHDVRAFFGGEARDLAPIAAYRAGHPPVDLALLPVNGLHVPFGPRLVMSAREAVDAATALGARTLVPIHDAHGRDLPWSFVRRRGSGVEARARAVSSGAGIDVAVLAPGETWEPPAAAA